MTKKNEKTETTTEVCERTRTEISAEVVRKGIDAGVVEFVVDPNMEFGTVAKIGDGWFYFGGLTAEEENPEEFLKNCDLDEVARDVAEVLRNFETESPDERDYYEACLREALGDEFETN